MEKARPVAAVAADGELRAHDYAEAVAKRMQTLDPWHMVHHAEGVAIEVEPSRCPDAATR